MRGIRTESAGGSLPALIIGFADCVREDVACAERLFPHHVKFGVNRAVLHFECDHLVSIDRSKIPEWIPDDHIVIHAGRSGGVNNQKSTELYPWVDCWWPELQGGSSGWMAAKIAYHMGYTPIILCGCPIDTSPHLEGDGKNNWVNNPNQAQSCRMVIEREEEYKPYVRSMSGWTREYFGAP